MIIKQRMTEKTYNHAKKKDCRTYGRNEGWRRWTPTTYSTSCWFLQRYSWEMKSFFPEPTWLRVKHNHSTCSFTEETVSNDTSIRNCCKPITWETFELLGIYLENPDPFLIDNYLWSCHVL